MRKNVERGRGEERRYGGGAGSRIRVPLRVRISSSTGPCRPPQVSVGATARILPKEPKTGLEDPLQKPALSISVAG